MEMRRLAPPNALAHDDDPRTRLASLFRAQYLSMVRVAFLLTGSNEVAEDLVQEAFLGLRKHWEDVDQPEAYLRTSVVNASRSWLRRQRTFRRHVRDWRPPLYENEVDELQDALAALPERQRTALVLRFYADLSEASIAEALGCREGTVKSLLHRGLARLRKAIDQ
jgi:RNA polymerase sigma-70 factor (sigma-E family)